MATEQVIQMGDFRIEFVEDKLRIMNTHNAKGIAVIPSSGNSVVIIPVERGFNQFKITK